MHSHSPTVELRHVIDALPLRTRLAMLEGVQANDIIVGTYTSKGLGICPMLAAHRQGAQNDFRAFAAAWDAMSGQYHVRSASKRELRVLVAHLEASILVDTDVAGEFNSAIADHQRLVNRIPEPPKRFVPEPQPAMEPARELVAEPVERRYTIEDLLPKPIPRRRLRGGVRPGDPDRSREGRLPGAGWLRPVRTYDEFERLVAAAEAMLAERDSRESREGELTGV